MVQMTPQGGSAVSTPIASFVGLLITMRVSVFFVGPRSASHHTQQPSSLVLGAVSGLFSKTQRLVGEGGGRLTS